MGLITILGEDNFTSEFYVKKGADSRKSRLIDTTRDKMAIFGHVMAEFDKILQVQSYRPISGKRGCNFQNKKLSYCWESARRENLLKIAEVDVEMTTYAEMIFKCTSKSSKVAPIES